MFDIPVYFYKTQLMQRIQRAVHDGYYYHTSGRVHFSKIAHLVEKFREKFRIDYSESTRNRNKKAGIASARLFIRPIPEAHEFFFLLLLTEGEHPNRSDEKWLDARVRGQRIRLHRDDYEIVQKPNHSGGASWTWRFTAEEFEAYESQVKSACRSKNKQRIYSVNASILAAPGFKNIRAQAKMLRQLGYSEYKKAFGASEKNENNPFDSSRLHGWVRASGNVTFPLSSLIANAEKALPRWFPKTAEELKADKTVENLRQHRKVDSS